MTDAYRENQKRVAAARREFRRAAAAAAAGRTFRDYDDFAGAVNDQIALERTAIDTTARRVPDYVAAAADITRRIEAAKEGA
jgi:hypothetical protein